MTQVLTELEKGQPVKFRSTGQDENMSRANVELNKVAIPAEDITLMLIQDSKKLMEFYANPNENEKNFLCSSIEFYCNHERKGFSNWYKHASSDVKNFLKEIGLDVRPPKKDIFSELEYIIFSNHTSDLENDVRLPEETRKRIETVTTQILNDKGNFNYDFGIFKDNEYNAIVFEFEPEKSWQHNFSNRYLPRFGYTYEVVPATLQEVMEKLEKEIQSYEPRIMLGGIRGAIDARKQSVLCDAHERLKSAKSNEEIYDIAKTDTRKFAIPNTGVYVLFPTEENENRSPFVLKSKPRHHEHLIEKVIEIFYPKKNSFGMLAYTAIEVPERALAFVTPEKTLELDYH